jgi:hypothetical protein
MPYDLTGIPVARKNRLDARKGNANSHELRTMRSAYPTASSVRGTEVSADMCPGLDELGEHYKMPPRRESYRSSSGSASGHPNHLGCGHLNFT